MENNVRPASNYTSVEEMDMGVESEAELLDGVSRSDSVAALKGTLSLLDAKYSKAKSSEEGLESETIQEAEAARESLEQVVARLDNARGSEFASVREEAYDKLETYSRIVGTL